MKQLGTLIAWFSLPLSTFAQGWQAMPEQFTIDGGAAVLELFDDTLTDRLIIGGAFTTTEMDNLFARVATWDGVNLGTIGCGFNHDCSGFTPPSDIRAPRSFLYFNDTLYASGSFTFSGSNDLNRVAKWTGEEWVQVGEGFSSGARIKVFDDELYACGSFLFSGETELNGFAKWTGTEWIDPYNVPELGGPGSINIINDFEFYQGELYLGGNFNGVDGMKDIIKWNGSEWVSVAGGLHGTFSSINRMTIFQDQLIIAGTFFMADSPLSPGNFIAAWDGTHWDDMNGGLQDPDNIGPYRVHDMHATDDWLYVGGLFYSAGGSPAHHVAAWNGSDWCGFGASEEDYFFVPPIYAVTVFRDQLWIGGSFWEIAGEPGFNKIAFTDQLECTVGVEEADRLNLELEVYPNPVSDLLHISIESTTDVHDFNIRISDSTGRVIGEHKGVPGINAISVSHYESGYYFLSVMSMSGYASNTVFIKLGN